MNDDALAGKAILIVEDEYVIATDLRQGLEAIGATVVGPAPSLPAAIELIKSGTHIDVAILDINLQGKMVFAVADLMWERSVPCHPRLPSLGINSGTEYSFLSEA